MRQLWFAVILLAACGAGFAADPPTIVEIVFEGNEVTRPRVMQRELVVEVGDPADPQALERSRQALLDLGLFRRVHLREEPVEGGVRIVFAVDERYYILPSPRLDAKSDGRYAYGLQFRWNNVAGLNHTLRVFVEEEERRRAGIGRETSYVASYSAPFVLRSPYSVAVSGSYLTRPVEEAGFEYTETFRAFGLGVSRFFSDGPASQGFTVGAGLNWLQQRTDGELAR
ncbi:MAG: POTRA domain-containing protein, partial [Gammaproteobacteria bacterium]